MGSPVDLSFAEGGDKAMTFENLSTWETMELRHLGDVAHVIHGTGGGGPANGKSIPTPGDPGEADKKPAGLE